MRLENLLGFPPVEDDEHRFVVVLSDGQRTLGVSVSEFVDSLVPRSVAS